MCILDTKEDSASFCLSYLNVFGKSKRKHIKPVNDKCLWE